MPLSCTIKEILSSVRSFFVGRGSAYSGPQHWNLLNRSNAPAQGEQVSW